MSETTDIVDSLCAAVVPTPMPTRGLLVAAAAEIERLRFAIRRLADQDATLSVCNGAVTVTMDATLTDAEREAIDYAAYFLGMAEADQRHVPVLQNLLARCAIGHQEGRD